MWVPSNLGSGQCKTGFLAIPKIWHSMPFFSMTIWVVRPRPMHQMTRHQNKKSPTIQEKKKTWFGTQKLAVGGQHIRHAPGCNSPNSPTAHPCGPNLVLLSSLLTLLTLLNIFFLQRFSKKIGNCQNHKQMRKCEMRKCQKCNISLVGGCNFYGRSQMVPLTIPKVILGVPGRSKRPYVRPQFRKKWHFCTFHAHARAYVIA